MAGGSLTTRRGFGAVYLPTYKDKRTGELRQSSIWWIQYSVHGQRKIENSHSRNRSDALKLLKRRLGEIVDGRLIVSAVERTRFQDLAELFINDYEINGRRSVVRAKRSINHLRDFFGLSRAIEITADRVSTFIAFRKRQGAANASINRELGPLQQKLTAPLARVHVARVQPLSITRAQLKPRHYFGETASFLRFGARHGHQEPGRDVTREPTVAQPASNSPSSSSPSGSVAPERTRTKLWMSPLVLISHAIHRDVVSSSPGRSDKNSLTSRFIRSISARNPETASR